MFQCLKSDPVCGNVFVSFKLLKSSGVDSHNDHHYSLNHLSVL